MTRHSRKHFKEGGVILSANSPKPEVTAVTSIEALEALRDKVQAEDWANPSAKRSVLFGIKMCIARLKHLGIHEITE